MGEIGRAKDRVLGCLSDDVEFTPQLDDALSALYALGERHGEAEAENRWLERTESLRHLARRATEFVSEGGDTDVTYPLFKEALECWWEFDAV